MMPQKVTASAKLLVRVGTAILLVLLLLGAYLLAEPVSPGRLMGRYSFKPSLLLGALVYLLAWGLYASLTSQSLRSTLARFLLTSAALIFVLGALELATLTRLIDYRNVFVSQAYGITVFDPFHDPTWQTDMELIHIRRGGITIEGTAEGNLAEGRRDAIQYPVHAQYDANGFRNEQVLERADVIVLGDSFIEAGLVPTPNMLTNQLSELLAAPVVNLGQCAYGPQQEAIVLGRYGLPLQPKVVVWCFFGGNDLTNIPGYESRIANLPQALAAHDGFTQRCLTKNVYQLITKLTAPAFIEPNAEAGGFPGIVTVDGTPTTMYFFYPGQPLNEDDEANLEKAKVVLQDAQEQVQRTGGRLLLAYIPIKFSVYEGLAEFPDESEPTSWKSNDLPDRMSAWCQAHDVAFLDLTVPLRQAAAAGEMVYLIDDTHWSSQGNQIAAQAIAKYILGQGWLNTVVDDAAESP